MNDQSFRFLATVLDQIEQIESRLLVWGIVDGYLSQYELSDIILPIIDSALESGLDEFYQPEDVIAVLLKHRWIVEVECSNDTIGYRSRMAETVRLLQRLRQLFPKHIKQPNGWQEAPTLVADFRFHRRKRQYPQRNIPLRDVLSNLKSVVDDNAVITGLKALLGHPGDNVLLAGFQVRSTERVLRAIEINKPLATIICAGTGSGKTLAFYLPALSSIIRHHLNGDSTNWVKTVALYPRAELLRDQFKEVLGRVIDVNRSLERVNIRVGTLFGDTPERSGSCYWKKARGSDDYICPTLKCMKCGSDLHWIESDYLNKIERLTCSARDCSWFIDSDLFPFTRETLKKNPPDILFTTTEMLNQRLSDNGLCHLFGVGSRANHPPELVLMDEVHTYEGRHGAQVAYLMRRWAHLTEAPLRLVGLSATLRDAPTFFASLIGASLTFVEEISPRSDELESEGAEYMIALRGDPVSRAALLSTTIQTAMLLQRTMDPKPPESEESVSHGLYGQKTFVFTDDLDVTNRLYFNLLNAEGRNSNGSPDMRNAPKGGLAILRSTGQSISRYRGGQDWRMCEALRTYLSERLIIERVSSQDPGVRSDADIVVATASLEVGFDDPLVGAVIQHKAPIGMAGFLQRRGRAGRKRKMRPWTAIVLSDYGRDRLAYQGYDLLFDPELPARTLPLTNRYITRMQAVFATIDYLGLKLQSSSEGSVWRDLSEYRKDKRIPILTKEIRSILESEYASKRLENHLVGALKLPKEEVSALLWEFPRPIMTMVLPTALRRLVSGWRALLKDREDFQIRNNPLPDFVPASLFANLNLAETEIIIPGNSEQSNRMPVYSALKEFAPGRISKRFGINYKNERYWISPSPEAITGHSLTNLSISETGVFNNIGKFSYWKDKIQINVPVYCPVAFNLNVPDKNIADTSNAQLKWYSQFVPQNYPTWLETPIESAWKELIPQLGFFMHARHSPLEVRRFATGSHAEIGVGRSEKFHIDINFVHDDSTVALGYNFLADGVLFQIKPPSELISSIVDRSEKSRSLRTMRFLDLAWKGEVLSSVQSPFLRLWIVDVFLSAITFEAIESIIELEAAITNIVSGTACISLDDVLTVLFQSQAQIVNEETELTSEDRLRKDLEVLLKNKDILEELQQHAKLLWEPISEEWLVWLSSVYQSTIGAAILKTIGDLCSSINVEDLSIDLDRGPGGTPDISPQNDEYKEVWITEKSPGGSGLIEEFMRCYAEDPRRFFSMLRANLEMGEFELIDHQLIKLLSLVTEQETPVKSVISSIRTSESHEQLTDGTRQLRRELLKAGFLPFHGFWVSMANRLLRPASSFSTDAYLHSAIQKWRSEEQRLGIEIDMRVICYWLSKMPDIDSVIDESGIPPGQERQAWRLNAIYGLLWARGRSIRHAPLQTRNPFAELPPVERLLVIDTIKNERERVSVEEPHWLENAVELLARGKLVTLECHSENRALLGFALHELITNPVETGYLRVFARLQGIRQDRYILEADIEILEAAQ